MLPTLNNKSRVFVSGHRGLVGTAVVNRLQQAGFVNILVADKRELDLRDPSAVDRWFADQRPEYVIHAAGKVGGIGANIAEPVDFAHDNLLIQATVLRAAWQHAVTKLLYLASSCVYPRDCPQPMQEKYLLTGPLESTNEGYALAKIMGIKSCQYYRRQYGCNFISALPTNLYGPGDKFDPQRSHVIPGLILKFHQAKMAGDSQVVIWGTGKPLREFLHVDDLADACLFLLERYDEEEPINVGTGEEVSIAELAQTIRDVVYPAAEIVFDPSKPDGTPRKLLGVCRLHQLGWRHQRHLREGLAATYDWFQNQRAQGQS
jgi:GDP-L-fucose synthase